MSTMAVWGGTKKSILNSWSCWGWYHWVEDYVSITCNLSKHVLLTYCFLVNGYNTRTNGSVCLQRNSHCIAGKSEFHLKHYYATYTGDLWLIQKYNLHGLLCYLILALHYFHGPPAWAVRDIKGFATYICVTRGMGTVCHGVYVRQQANMI